MTYCALRRRRVWRRECRRWGYVVEWAYGAGHRATGVYRAARRDSAARDGAWGCRFASVHDRLAGVEM